MTGNLNPPPGSTPAFREVWTQTLEQIMGAGTIARVDPNSLSAYVSAVLTHQRATALLNQTDILTDQGGKPGPNPALAVQRDAASTIAQFARQFRLTAAAPPPQPGQEPTDEPEPRKDHYGTWCGQHGRWECYAPKTGGRGPCHKIAEPPDGRCSQFHGGRGKAAKVLAARLVREPTYGTPARVTAEQALVEELWRTAGHVKWLGERVAELEAAALTWGQSSTVTRWWGEFPGREAVEKSGPHVLLDLYDRERRHLVHIATSIVSAGLAAKLISAAQEQGAAFARCTDAILHDLGLSEEQWAMVPEVVPRRFRELMPA